MYSVVATMRPRTKHALKCGMTRKKWRVCTGVVHGNRRLSSPMSVVNEYESFAGHCMRPSDLQNDPHKLGGGGGGVRVILTRIFEMLQQHIMYDMKSL